MKLSKLFYPLFLLFILLTVSNSLEAQYQFQVTKATDKALPVTARGIYYALPKTIFKVKLILEKVEQIRGPFAAYTEKYLGTSDFIKANGSYLHLLAVDVQPVNMADPSQLYYVQFPEDRSAKETRQFGLQLNDQGVLVAFGPKKDSKSAKENEEVSSQTYIYSDNTRSFKMAAGYSRAQKVDTIVRKFTIDTLTIKRFLYKTSWINLSEEDRANDAAQQIKKLRDSRFNLLTGYQEVNYGNGIRYMDSELQKLEKQYLALFLGRETKQMVVRSFVFDPEKGQLYKQLIQFTDATGQVRNITLNIRVTNALALPVAPLLKPGFIFYRIPVKAEVQVLVGSKPFYSDVFTIPQLGVVSSTSIKNTQLHFDWQTGTLTGIEKR